MTSTEITKTAEAIVSSLASRGIAATIEYNGNAAMVKDDSGRYAMVKGAGCPFTIASVKFGHIPSGEHASLGADSFSYDARHLGHSVGVRLAGMAA